MLNNLFYHHPVVYCFGVFGVIRGIQYDRNRHLSMYRNTLMLTTSIFMGVCWGVIYSCPLYMPFIIYKELYRFEVWVRNLPIEDDYYDIV